MSTYSTIALPTQLPSLVTSGLSFTSIETAGIHWLANAVHCLEYCMLYMERTD